MQKLFYATSYPVKLKCGTIMRYSSYVKATSLEEAYLKITNRNIGEELTSTTPVDSYNPICNLLYLFDNKNYKEACHCMSFILWVLLKAGKIDVTYQLSDVGALHELIHLATDVYENQDLGDYFYKDLREQIHQIQTLFDELSH